MAKTLFELAQEYLNQGMPDISQTPRVVTPPPATTMPVPIPPGGSPTARILPMPQGGGGGDGFGVYNSDPNSTRTQNNYSPYDYRQAFGKTDYRDFDPSSTYAAKQMEMNPEYYEGKQLTGIPGAAQNYLKNSFLGKGLSALGDKLPVNRRAILENELLGSGMQLNDIGQFVSDGGDINKADGSNIMAGYNAAKVTQETFDKRRATINAKMKDPKQKAAKLAALDAAEESFFGAKTKADMIFENKMIEKDPSLKGPDYLKDSFNFTTNKDENNIFAANDKLTDPNITSNMINEFGFGGEYGSSDDNFPSAPPTTVDMINEFGFGGEYGSADDNFPSAPVATPTVDQLNEFGYGGGYGSSDDNFPGSPIPTPTVNQINEFGYGQNYGSADDNFPSNPITTPGITPAMVNEFGFGGGYGSADDNFPSAPVATPTAEMINEFGTNPTYDPGPFDYQMQPSNVYQGGGSDNSSVSPSGDVTSSSGQYQGNINDEFSQPAPTQSGPTYSGMGSIGSGGGGGNDSGGGGKIVCTMMNESYGFGSFRNKIWLKHSKDMAPEYQIGYHKIFLPLIKIAKTNKVVKKILEHIAVHRTLDIRQEARGKVHLLGRLYRKILEPLCYLVGKHG